MKIGHTLLALLILTVIISGCVDNGTEQTMPASEPIIIETTPVETIEPTYTAEPGPAPAIQVRNIGQSVTDDNTKMTLNDVMYTYVINEARAESGNQFLIINITTENIGNKNLSYSGDQFIVLSYDGQYVYEEDISSSVLVQHFNGENILPGYKRQGELVFQIPVDVKDIKLRFEYSSDSPGELKLEFFKLDR